MESIWLTLSTITTVGYGDYAAQSVFGQISTIILLYLFGITVLAQTASEYIDFRLDRQRKIREGHWRLNMKDHILIINSPKHNARGFFERLVKQIREVPELHDMPIQLLSLRFPDGLPDSLTKMGMALMQGYRDSNQDLLDAGALTAKHILVIARDENKRSSDSVTYDVTHRLFEINSSARILIECVEDENRDRFLKMGVNSVLRPVRAYPEIIVRSLADPGAERILENLFTYSGDHPHRYTVTIHNQRWADIVCAIMNADLGTALGYVEHTSHGREVIVSHPDAETLVSCEALLIMVKQIHTPSRNNILNCLSAVNLLVETEK